MQLSKCIQPFGEVNVFKQSNGELQIVATVLMAPNTEQARTGLALDASASMKETYGAGNPLFGDAKPNLMRPIAQTMAAYLSEFSEKGTCETIYWAVNNAGDAIERIGELDSNTSKSESFEGPKNYPWGRGTKLLPPVKYFVENAFDKVTWSIAVFVTDGIIQDLDEVKQYCLEYGKKIAAGQANFVKMVLIGIGPEVDEGQMEELDDMFEGSGLVDKKGDDIDIWDHALAAQMTSLEQIFKEVVSKDTIVASSGRVYDSSGTLVQEWTDGLPSIMRFNLPAGSTSFKLEHPGGSVTQDISEAV
jgi:hypothetical protein